MPAGGKVAVFAPHPMLSITVASLTGEGGDDIHLHAAGQGVWVARMAAELGAEPALCGFIGGETGTVLRPLLERLSVENAPDRNRCRKWLLPPRSPQRRVGTSCPERGDAAAGAANFLRHASAAARAGSSRTWREGSSCARYRRL